MCATAAGRGEWDMGENSPAGTMEQPAAQQPAGPVAGGSAGRAAAHVGSVGGTPVSHGSGQALEQKVGRRRWFFFLKCVCLLAKDNK